MILSPIVLVVLGLVLAFAGKRFIWLLIGIAGFVLGYNLIAIFIPDQAGLVQLVAGVVVGVIFAWLAGKFAKILLMVAAFILIGNAVLALADNFGITGGIGQLIFFVIGGLIGLALMRFAFKWAIIAVCALGGGAMVMQGLPALLNQPSGGTLALIAGIVVAIAGFVVQARDKTEVQTS